MVLIYTNESNPSTLKLVIAANLAKEEVDLKVVNVHDNSIPQPKHLPYLKINEEQIFFSANSGVCYFLPTTNDNYTDVIDLLEWEAKNVSPELAHVLGASTRNDKVKASLVSSLNFLNEHIQNKNFLVGDSITAADVVIWSTIYPLSACPKNSKEYLSSFTNITNWIQRLGSKQEFEKALSIFKLDISTSYSALLTGAKYLSISDDNQKDKHEKEHIYEAITAEELEFAKTSWRKDIKQQPQLKKLQAPVLPVAGERNVFVTSALPYVNNVPHLGNIIGCVLSADVFVRYSRLCNNNTIYMGGTDEYGTATEAKALEEGISCQEICDKYYKIHKDIYDWFNISFDHFGRTSAPYQTDICQEMFITLNNNGFTFTESIEQLHCEKCNKFLADRFVEGGCPHPGCHYEDARGDQCDSCGKLVNAIDLINPKCKVCSSSPQVKKSNQFFIDLPKLEPLIHHWLKIRCTGWSHNAQVIAKAWLKEGLRPRCITRDLKWGVPVPLDGFRNKVFYVWFDAVMGYLSISKAYTRDYMKWWKPGKDTSVTLYQFMAKDNVPFHAILFPAMLLGANEGYITVNHLMATEYLNYEDGKFSKSRGVGVFGTDARSTGIPSDIWRFYLLYVRPESQDSSFSWADFATKHNSELLNNLGNFINRALVFAKNNYNKILPEMKLSEEDYNLLALCTRELKSYTESLEKAKLRDGIRHILAISRHGNQYMQSNQPWVLLKGSDEEKIRAGTVIGVCCNLACLIATLLQPYMPDTSDNLTKQLNTTRIVINPKNCEIVTMLPAGHKLGEPSPLFTKIELATVEELKQKFAGKQGVNGSNGDAPAPKPQPTQKIQLSPEELKKLEEEIVKQGLVVRQLKESGAAKPVWVPEVDKLLDLKNQLSQATGVSASGKGKKGKK